MAFEEKKYLDLAGLQSYDAKIKAKIDAADTTLSEAIDEVAGELEAEITNRQLAEEAINNKIGEVPEGKTVVGMIAEAQEAATYDDTEVKEGIKNNKEAIEAINNAETGILKTAKDYADEKVKALADGAVKTNTDAIAALDERVEAEEGKVAKLIGDDADLSVREIANQELAKQLIPEGAQEALDTLAEIAAWIQDHPEDVAAINLAIENLEKLVGTIPEDATATDIVGYIAEAVAAEKTRAELVEADLDERLEAVEEVLGEGGGVDERIAGAIAELDADVTSAAPEAGKGLQVQVVEVDGVITTVAVTGNYDEAYDAKGAAAAAQTAATEAAATDATNKADQALVDAKAYVDAETAKIKVVSTEDIDALFAATE